MTIVQPTSTLETVLNAAKTGDSFQLVKGGKYEISKPVIPTAGGWSLDCLQAQVDIGPACTGTVLDITKPNITVSNMAVVPTTANKNNVLCRVTADSFTFQGAIIHDGLEQVGVCNPGGTRAAFKNNTLGVTGSCTLYTEENTTTWSGNILAGSSGETTLRVDRRSGGTVAQNPNGTVITGNTIHALNGKGVGELRESQNTTFTNNTCYDYLRIGQDGILVTAVDVDDIHVTVSGNTWVAWPNLGVTNVCLMIKGGSTVAVNLNHFPAVATSYFATVDQPSIVSFTSNTRHVPKGITPRAIYWTGKSTHVTAAGFTTVAA